MATVDYGARVDSTLQRIEENDEIHPENKELIANFKRDLALDGMSDGWLQKLTSHLKIVAEHLGDRSFREIDKEEMKNLVEWVHNRTKENGDPVSDATINSYKQVIKRFYRWLHDKPKGEHPEVTAWINTGGQSENNILPKDLLTMEEIEVLIEDGCRNARDKALIALLWETGARMGELIDLTVGDIEDHSHGRKVVIEGKTGHRRLPLVESSPYLNKWLNEHPTGTKDAPLWCGVQPGNASPDGLSYHYIRQKLLVRAKERVGIEKPVNPHHFRHSRATYLANKFTEAQMCEWFGWVKGSDMPSKYVHLSGRDIDKAYFDQHGLIPAEEKEKEDSITQCPRCEEINRKNAKYCDKCGQGLDAEARGEVEVEQERTEEAVVEVENKTESKILMSVLKELRENPGRFLADG